MSLLYYVCIVYCLGLENLKDGYKQDTKLAFIVKVCTLSFTVSNTVLIIIINMGLNRHIDDLFSYV